MEGGNVGLGGVGRTECGDSGDGGMVSPGEVFGAVGERGWEGAAQGVDEVMVGVAREQGGEGLVVWGGGVGHGLDHSVMGSH